VSADAVVLVERLAEEDQRGLLRAQQGLLRGVLCAPAQALQQPQQCALLLERVGVCRRRGPAHAAQGQRDLVL